MIIPNVPIPISTIRPNDILLLLTIGTLSEITFRALLRSSKNRSPKEFDLRQTLKQLRLETARARKLGPSAFVETSKLERKVLAVEKDLASVQEGRVESGKKVKKLVTNLGRLLNVILFFSYYGIPLLNVDGFRLTLDHSAMATEQFRGEGEEEMDLAMAGSYLNGVLFPLSYVGFGMRLSRFGIHDKASSVAALIVYWSAQVMVGKTYECVETLMLR